LELFEELIEESSFLKTGHDLLDQTLCGGIPFNSITEIVGPSGTGKTQFCYTLISILLSKTCNNIKPSEILYFDTEFTFRTHR
jgi:RAD51-like protein 1